MTKEQVDQLAADCGAAAVKQVKPLIDEIEKNMNTKYAEMKSGTVSADDFKKFQDDSLKQVNEVLAKLKDISEANIENATKLGELLDNKPGVKKTMTEFLQPFVSKLGELKMAGTGFIEVTGAQMKEAGVTAVSTSISPATPYLPGLAGTPLEIFDIVRPENFMITRVDMGSTDQFKLAWINELPMEGDVNTNIAESGTKPLVQHLFTVEVSTALKAAAYQILTEEFEQDVPQLASEVRGMLQRDVIRAFDDAISAFVFSVAKDFNLSALNMEIFQANLWDAAYSLITQVGYNNFDPNALAMNWITNAKMQMSKNANGTYVLPPFGPELQAMLVRTNKIVTNIALGGDLRQVRVRMYKDYTLRMGWINDQFIKNQFAILGELRYHRFISENRKSALAKGDLNNIADIINGTPGS
jgi:hypothetical protein